MFRKNPPIGKWENMKMSTLLARGMTKSISLVISSNNYHRVSNTQNNEQKPYGSVGRIKPQFEGLVVHHCTPIAHNLTLFSFPWLISFEI